MDPNEFNDDHSDAEDGEDTGVRRPRKQQHQGKEHRQRQREGKGDGDDDGKDYRLPGLPRYVRINTLKISLKAANKAMHEAGYHHCPDPRHPGKRSFYKDETVPDVMVFKPKGKSDISRLPLVATGEVVIQQKASCFPALALAPPPGSVVVDGCAAPGNKTSHLAALMQNKGEVYAFERDARRCELLKQMMAVKGATCVTAVHASFLDADPADPRFARVTHVLLDPSCSSSGMSKTPFTEPAEIAQLAADQTALILHAMKFPRLRELCYSTCSIYEEENEQVVAAVLAAQPKPAKGARRFGLTTALPSWPRRGHALASLAPEEARHIAESVVRCQYPDDCTIGFFLAKFVLEGAQPDPPCAELQQKLDALHRVRGKHAKAAPPPKAAPGGAVAAAAPAAAREVPAWRRERDERLKQQKEAKKQRTA